MDERARYVDVREWLVAAGGEGMLHRWALSIVGAASGWSADKVAGMISESFGPGAREVVTSRDVHQYRQAGVRLLGRCPHGWLTEEVLRVLVVEPRLVRVLFGGRVCCEVVGRLVVGRQRLVAMGTGDEVAV